MPFHYFQPITRRQILDSSKLKEFADHNFKFHENGRKLSKRLENLWEKEKLLFTNNFSFSHSIFKRLVSQGHSKASLCGNGLRKVPKIIIHEEVCNTFFLTFKITIPNDKFLNQELGRKLRLINILENNCYKIILLKYELSTRDSSESLPNSQFLARAKRKKEF